MISDTPGRGGLKRANFSGRPLCNGKWMAPYLLLLPQPVKGMCIVDCVRACAARVTNTRARAA